MFTKSKLTTQEAKKILGVTVDAVIKLINREKIKATYNKVMRRWLIDADSLHKYKGQRLLKKENHKIRVASKNKRKKKS